jgi:hypothetical protein
MGRMKSRLNFWVKFSQINYLTYLYKKENMKIIITLSQLKRILQTEDAKFPITFEVANFTDEELKEFSQLLQQKERG